MFDTWSPFDYIDQCSCCGYLFLKRIDNDPWEGRLDGYCYDCALARCDAYPGACGKERVG